MKTKLLALLAVSLYLALLPVIRFIFRSARPASALAR